jgi:hypothetical protein
VKKIESRFACGIILIICIDCLLLIELISGMNILTEKNFLPIILCCLPFFIIFVPLLSLDYDEQNNNNRLFNIIGSILFLLCVIFLWLR